MSRLYHHLQDENSVDQETSARWFLVRIIFDPEDGSFTFFRNVGSHTDYKALDPNDGKIHNYRCENLKSYKSAQARHFKHLQIYTTFYIVTSYNNFFTGVILF
jgi:hypothetical protein